MAYAIAKRKDTPRFLSELHPKYNTPCYSIMAAGAVMVFLVLFVDLTKVVALSTFALLFYYALTNVCALRLKTRNRIYPKFVSLLGAVSCVTLLAFTFLALTQAWIVGVGVLAVGAACYRMKNRLT